MVLPSLRSGGSAVGLCALSQLGVECHQRGLDSHTGETTCSTFCLRIAVWFKSKQSPCSSSPLSSHFLGRRDRPVFLSPSLPFQVGKLSRRREHRAELGTGPWQAEPGPQPYSSRLHLAPRAFGHLIIQMGAQLSPIDFCAFANPSKRTSPAAGPQSTLDM